MSREHYDSYSHDLFGNRRFYDSYWHELGFGEFVMEETVYDPRDLALDRGYYYQVDDVVKSRGFLLRKFLRKSKKCVVKIVTVKPIFKKVK